jgi:hypothetical protein
MKSTAVVVEAGDVMPAVEVQMRVRIGQINKARLWLASALLRVVSAVYPFEMRVVVKT